MRSAPPASSQRLLEIRVPELIAYQERGATRADYVHFVKRVREAERPQVRPASRGCPRRSRAICSSSWPTRTSTRSRACIAQARHRARAGRGVPGRGQAPLQPPPAAAPRARPQGEDQARPVVRVGLRACSPRMKRLRGTPLDPVRLRRGAPGRAAAPRRVSRARREGARRPVARELRARGQAGEPARPDPRLRGHQAPQRRSASGTRSARSASDHSPVLAVAGRKRALGETRCRISSGR